MTKLPKITSVNKYMTAIKIANLIRTATYVSVAAISVFKVFKVYRAMVK